MGEALLIRRGSAPAPFTPTLTEKTVPFGPGTTTSFTCTFDPKKCYTISFANGTSADMDLFAVRYGVFTILQKKHTYITDTFSNNTLTCSMNDNAYGVKPHKIIEL